MASEEPRKKRSKRWLTAGFIAFNVIVVLITAHMEYSSSNGAENFFSLQINWIYFLFAAVSMAAAILAEIRKHALMMTDLHGKPQWHTAYEVMILGRYYDNITPSGIGGQAFQVVYLRRAGLTAGEATALPVAAFLNMQVSFVALAAFLFILNGGVTQHALLLVMAYVGLFLYLLLPLAIVLFTVAPVFSEKIIRWAILKVGAKIRWIKDPQALYERVLNALNGYRDALRLIYRNKSLSWKLAGLSVLYQLGTCSVPFFVIRMFGGSISWIDAITITMYVMASVAIIPTPGNAGAAEGSFYLVFSRLAPGKIFWAMLVWRLFVYYLYLFWGMGIYIRKHIQNRILARSIAKGEATAPPLGQEDPARSPDPDAQGKTDSESAGNIPSSSP
jgi:uncharacterized protein (TIRG00374 family)